MPSCIRYDFLIYPPAVHHVQKAALKAQSLMLRHQIITRALLKAKGRRVPEFFGLDHSSFRELAILGRHCEAQLRLSVTSVSALGPDSASGVRLELRGQRGRSYQVRVSPYDGVSLEAGPFGGPPRQVFRHHSFDHASAGELFRTIKAQEKNG